ncbi:MAG: hypothetical protein HZA61_06445 [Candidatus Eisenbacteria bacterium]|uniref:Uncharacterized protein n=1 Tax=Eiseniibacteriota bacterium TaxID=2212470 RepID=A0A933W2Q6_UNCEI|nr:hypothetical protein [Candidatus Eisenbacteria bacterium]
MRHRFALLTALALVATFSTAVQAGGIHAKVEGPAADGRTYTVRMVGCASDDSFEPWGAAEGLVQGERATKLLRFEPTGEHGVFTFTRNWPEQGKWLIRLSPGHPPAPATVVQLSRDGKAGKHKFYLKSDGIRESHRTLLPNEKREEGDC